MFYKRSTPIQAKECRYRMNGTGRDSYITQQGFGPESYNISSNMQVTGERMQHKATNNSWNVSCKPLYKQQPKPGNGLRMNSVIRYTSDGSGRDHYITSNFGGTAKGNGGNPMNFANTLFKATLRDYNVIPNQQEWYSQIDCHKTGQLWRSKYLSKEDQKSSMRQSLQISRLSIPKHMSQTYRETRKNFRPQSASNKKGYQQTQNSFYNERHTNCVTEPDESANQFYQVQQKYTPNTQGKRNNRIQSVANYYDIPKATSVSIHNNIQQHSKNEIRPQSSYNKRVYRSLTGLPANNDKKQKDEKSPQSGNSNESLQF